MRPINRRQLLASTAFATLAGPSALLGTASAGGPIGRTRPSQERRSPEQPLREQASRERPSRERPSGLAAPP